MNAVIEWPVAGQWFAAEYAQLSPEDRLRMRKVLQLLAQQQHSSTLQERRTADAENALTLARTYRDREVWRSRSLARQHRKERLLMGLPFR